MTLPRNIDQSDFLGGEENHSRQGAFPTTSSSCYNNYTTNFDVVKNTNSSSEVKTAKPTARIIPHSNSSLSREFPKSTVELSTDEIASVNIKTKISQFEYLAARNCHRYENRFPTEFADSGCLKPSGKKYDVDEQYENCDYDRVDLQEGKKMEDSGYRINQQSEMTEDDPEIERLRLEEILNVCAEYEKQAQLEKNTKHSPNRIKTNGSLPRDRRAPPLNTNTMRMSPQLGLSSVHPVDRSPALLSTPSSSSYCDNRSPFNFDNLTVGGGDMLLCQGSDSTSGGGVMTTTTPTTTSGSPYCEGSSTKRIFDFSSVLERDNYTEHVIKTYPVEHSSRTKIKTIITPYKDSRNEKNYQSFDQITSMNKSATLDSKTSPEFCEQISPTNGNISSSQSSHSFKYLTLPKDSKLVEKNIQIQTTTTPPNDDGIEKLIVLRKEMEKTIVQLKGSLAENENYFEELIREFEMEKALLTGEYTSKFTEHRNLELRQKKLSLLAQKIDQNMTEIQQTQNDDQKRCCEKLTQAQTVVRKIEDNLNTLNSNKTSEKYETAFNEFLLAQEVLDNERKTFEDLEFHHLEKEADLLASREELQREIVDMSNKMEDLKLGLKDLKMQLDIATETHTNDHTRLEQRRLELHRRVSETRNYLKLIDVQIGNSKPKVTGYNSSSVLSQSSRRHYLEEDGDSDNSSSLEDYSLRRSETRDESIGNDFSENFNMSQSVNEKMFHSKSFGNIGLEKKTPSQGDIDRICKVTSNSPMNIIEDSGKKTIESLMELERNRHLHLVETGSEVIENERRRMIAVKQRAQLEVRNEWARRKPDYSSTLNSSEQIVHVSDDENDCRESRDTIDSHLVHKEMENDNNQGTLSKRNLQTKDKQRPLTRYLPIKSAELDLRQHIITAGHQVILCPHVFLNGSICRGFLQKKRSKFNGWSRRWFVFDRNKRSLVYYTDKNEKKARGGTYFQAIEEVYLDHSNSVHSPNPHLSFVMKTQQRLYHLMAPSAEAMRIWIDVIFTGAEGYFGFGQNF